MTDFKIEKIQARWVLDSRGNPTVECDLIADKRLERAIVPSGASTGELEALELRDGGDKFLGKHVSKAVSNVNDKIVKSLIGMDVREQNLIDKKMLELDGTDNKSNLGANAILSVSLAVAKLAARLKNEPLFSHLHQISYEKKNEDYLLPIPCCNILNGGEHAGNELAIQEFMILPIGADSFSTAIRYASEVYHILKGILSKKYGKSAINVGDEGGFAPNLSNSREALDVIIEAIEERGFTPGKEFILAMDAAASEFYENGKYLIDGNQLNEAELLEYYLDLIKEYPLKSIEDPFDEKDFGAFSELTNKVDNSIQIVDDDITVTNINILQKAINLEAGNALLLKVNQIGSLSEAINAAKMAFKNDFNVMVSHRSGETEDTFIADLAVGLCSGQIKSGAPCRSDRCAKYNQILRIEELLGENAKYPSDFKSWKKFV
ncbi:MAG: phosphopyruvate hydratase [Candidatus Lokiarchaeota archaeon]|nr:phosphopyruvate hydratase [Candidatus Lokiarchaeota archaeon]MBD3202353.1 phosphopyruvate hydratase [Candidatus Lokiarchaeota archaeon]